MEAPRTHLWYQFQVGELLLLMSIVAVVAAQAARWPVEEQVRGPVTYYVPKPVYETIAITRAPTADEALRRTAIASTAVVLTWWLLRALWWRMMRHQWR